ncbi:MAG: hypothetical protein IJ618_07715 [Prevotella sp.]|nr:hypothetical protein [Prevotella sp.]
MDTNIEMNNPEEELQTGGHKIMRYVLIVALIIAIAAVGIGYYFYSDRLSNNEERLYERALKSSEPAILEQYLSFYPDAPKEHRDSIEAHLKALKQVDLEWAEAVARNSSEFLERFIRRHPGNVHIPDARIRIDSLDYLRAVDSCTVEAFSQYMSKHREGMYYDYASIKLDSLQKAIERQRKEAERDSILRAEGGEEDELLLDM